ncbi:MAG: methyl-accepting chemotaxis protein, partial [Sporomusaceae bacterium]|nr:methyl-accepting chemotaxis protein [Sporomusaceae bacterium]
FFIANTITKPLNAAAQYVNKIAKGDLSKSVDKNLAAKSDESGEIARSIGAMQRAFKSIIEHVISLSVDSAKLINQSHDAMQELDRHIQETSSASMTLSANMQESAAAAEEMSATTHEIAASASLIAQKAAAGAENVKVISKRATELKMAVAQSQKETQQIREQIDAKLSKAIEESQSIEEINRLSESILQITAQTTLLSLNAAIEAARAGEQGRGFAVVANEIKNLADNSKDTVKEIQTITAVVINSVVHLVESSKEMLAFIDEKVVKDYENMVDTGETYDQDAKSVEIVLREFSEASSALSSSVETLLQAIESVAIASNDGAQNVIDIATKAAQVSALSEDVKNSIAEIKHSSLALGESVQVFKI